MKNCVVVEVKFRIFLTQRSGQIRSWRLVLKEETQHLLFESEQTLDHTLLPGV